MEISGAHQAGGEREQNGQDATTVGEPRAEEAGRHQDPTADSSAAAQAVGNGSCPFSGTAADRGTAEPYKGTVVALLGGITGIIAELLAHAGGATVTLGEFSSQPGITYFFSIVIFVVLAVVAAIALVRKHAC